MHFRFHVAFILFAFILASTGTAHADEFHYNNILIGDRAATMGGAYVAVSDDPAGLYYNPAGIVYASGKNLSASVNAFYKLKKKYDYVIGGHGWERDSSALLPNFFGIIQPIGNFKIGFSYAVPDSILEDQDQTFYRLPSNIVNTIVDRYVINFNNEDTTNNFGPSVATELFKDFAVGFTLYVHKRDAQWSLNQIVNLSDKRYEWTNNYFETNEWGIRPVLGVIMSPIDKISLGFTASRTYVFQSETHSQTTFKDISYNGNTLTRTITGIIDKKQYPYHFAGGFAYFPSKSLIISADMSYHTSVIDKTFGNRAEVYNYAIGTEYFITRNYAVRAGVYTNNANTYPVEFGYIGQPEHIDMYGGGLSVSQFSKNTSITAGGGMTYGTGLAQIITGSSRIQDVSSLSYSLFVSSAYSY